MRTQTHKSRRKTVVAALAIIGLVAASCGGDDDDASPTDSTPSDVSADTSSVDGEDSTGSESTGEEQSGDDATQDTAAEENTAAEDVSNVGEGREIVIGGVYSDTGAVPFTNAMGAAEAFWDNVNANGGINGYEINFVAIDDAQDANNNAASVKKLVETDGAIAVATVAENSSLGGMEVAVDAGVPFLGTYSQPAWFQTDGVFPIGAFYQKALAVAVVGQAVNAGLSKMALVTIAAPTAEIAADLFREQIEAGGMELVEDISYEPTETDFTGQSSLINSSGAEIVVCLCAQGHIPSWAQSAELQGYEGILFATGYSPEFKNLIGPWSNGRLWTAAPVAPLGSEEATSAAEKIGSEYDSGLDVTSINFAYSWTQAEMLAEAIRRVGAAEMTSDNLTAALRTFDGWEGTYNVPLTFGEGVQSDPANCIQLQVVDPDGTLVPVGGERFHCWEGSVAPE